LIPTVIICLRAPMRIYYDEKLNKTTATFISPFIPFRYFKKNLPHHTFHEYSTKFVKKGALTDGKMKLLLKPDLFRQPSDFRRLLSQK